MSENSKRILLVDDNKTNQILTVKILNKLGLHVEVAENGVEGVKAAMKKHFDLIFIVSARKLKAWCHGIRHHIHKFRLQ